MKKFVTREVLGPLATRIGTALSGYLIGAFAADPSLTNEVGTAIAAVLLVTVDLLTSAYNRHKREE